LAARTVHGVAATPQDRPSPALWRVKGVRTFAPGMFFDRRFLGAFLIPVALHMIWNSPIPSPFFVKHLILGGIGWFVVFGMVQQGLWQIRDVQLEQTRQELHTTRRMMALINGLDSVVRKGFQRKGPRGRVFRGRV
jgi:hypothetical protein